MVKAGDEPVDGSDSGMPSIRYKCMSLSQKLRVTQISLSVRSGPAEVGPSDVDPQKLFVTAGLSITLHHIPSLTRIHTTAQSWRNPDPMAL